MIYFVTKKIVNNLTTIHYYKFMIKVSTRKNYLSSMYSVKVILEWGLLLTTS